MTAPPKRPGALATAGRDADQNFVAAPAGQAVDPCTQMPKLTLHVDANRDGKVDDVVDQTWAYGKGKKGAVILCNNDDDEDVARLKHGFDNQNEIVDTHDESDIAPLVIRKTPQSKTFPAGCKAVLEVSDASKIRIFDKQAAGGKEIIGPKAGKTYTLPDPNTKELTLGMEAIGYPTERWPLGSHHIVLKVFDPGGKQCSFHEVQVRTAPWLMSNHLNETERIYVVAMPDNAQFRADLKTALGDFGSPLEVVEIPGVPYALDQWAQDVMELGSAAMPRAGSPGPGAGWHAAVVMRTPEDRKTRQNSPNLDRYPKEKLLGRDFGFHETRPPKDLDSLNAFGNLECSPPVKAKDGVEYPFGRIVFGIDTNRALDRTVTSFLHAQHVQEPFGIYTGWLSVGHIDEILSFCPFPGAKDPFKRFKVVMASPKVALDALKAVQDAGQGSTATMFQGMKPSSKTLNPAVYLPTLRTPDGILSNAAFVKDQRDVQDRINHARQVLRTELNLADDDFLHLPVLFRRAPDPSDPTVRYLPYTPNPVNMLVATRSNGSALLCIPRPFGPIVAVKDSRGNVVERYCQFEHEIRMQLAKAGKTNTIRFIDDFFTYHEAYGEVHCGTNSKRKARTDRWWWELNIK